MDFAEILTTAAATITLFFSAVYTIGRIIKDDSIIDIAWGAGQVVLAGTLLAVFGDETSFLRILVSILIALWGARLALHIGFRKIGKPEDWRYANWRKEWGNTYWWRVILQVYVLQGILLLIMAAPVYVVTHQSNLDVNDDAWLTAFGAFIWWYGFLFETVGDLQLKQFIADKKNKGKIMKDGLWKYTRHPNYFGEVTQWWGLFIIVAPLNYGLFAIVSPILITILILRVSGITMLEAKYDKNKAYQTYKKKTSAFFPLPPKK